MYTTPQTPQRQDRANKSPAGRRGSGILRDSGGWTATLHRRPLLPEAFAAIDRTVAAGLEGQLSLLAALAADCREVLARGPSAAPPGASASAGTLAAGPGRTLPLPLRLAARRAALGFVLVAERLVEFLLGRGVREILPTFDALQCLVRERRHTRFLFNRDPTRSPKPPVRSS